MQQTSFDRRSLLKAAALAPLLAASPWSAAQSWPTRPIKFIVPFTPGGATDTLARILAEAMPGKLGQSAVVENKPGAGTVIGVTAVTKAPADGYTVLVSAGSSFSVLPALKPNLAYDVEKDLILVNLSVTTPLVLVTGGSQPYARLSDLIAQAKARPKGLRYSTYGPGTTPHLATEYFAAAAKIDVEPIPYKGSSDAVLGLLRGDVDFGLETMTAAQSLIKAGKLKALAVTMPQRSQYMPDVPGLEEFKLSQASFYAYYAVALPAGTPAAVVDKLARTVDEILKTQEAKDKLTAQSLDIVSRGPDEAKAFVQKDMMQLRELGKRLKIELE